MRARRFRRNRKRATVTTADTVTVTQPGNQSFEKGNVFKGDVTVAGRRGTTARHANEAKTVTLAAEPRWQLVDGAAYAAAIGLATVAAWFSIKGMVVLFQAG